MANEKAEFIHSSNAYINITAIAYIKTTESGLTIFLKDNAETFKVEPPYVAKVEEFLAKHTVLEILKERPPGEFRRESIL
jgi:hypothetical protein